MSPEYHITRCGPKPDRHRSLLTLRDHQVHAEEPASELRRLPRHPFVKTTNEGHFDSTHRPCSAEACHLFCRLSAGLDERRGMGSRSAVARRGVVTNGELTLSLAASGIMRLAAWQGPDDARSPYLTVLQQALDRLTWACWNERVDPPRGVADLASVWCGDGVDEAVVERSRRRDDDGPRRWRHPPDPARGAPDPAVGAKAPSLRRASPSPRCRSSPSPPVGGTGCPMAAAWRCSACAGRWTLGVHPVGGPP